MVDEHPAEHRALFVIVCVEGRLVTEASQTVLGLSRERLKLETVRSSRGAAGRAARRS